MRSPATGAKCDLTPDQREVLRVVLGHMIPASTEFDVPGADDPAILADIVASLDRDAEVVREALDILAQATPGGFHRSARDQQAAALGKFRETHAAHASALYLAAVKCYYRDERVMRSLGMEIRPPFPQGYSITEGDLSLLEPVRARGQIWREATD